MVRAVSKAEAEALDVHDAEVAERHVLHRHVELRRRRHAAFVVDEDLARDVVPVCEAVARVNVRQRENHVHESYRCAEESKGFAEGNSVADPG
jgi:hypothetical protein